MTLQTESAMCCRGVSEAHLLRLAAAVEAGTRHPIADAVLACVRERGLDIPEAQDSRSQPGAGACCTIDGKAVRRCSGSPRGGCVRCAAWWHQIALRAAHQSDVHTGMLFALAGRLLPLR